MESLIRNNRALADILSKSVKRAAPDVWEWSIPSPFPDYPLTPIPLPREELEGELS